MRNLTSTLNSPENKPSFLQNGAWQRRLLLVFSTLITATLTALLAHFLNSPSIFSLAVWLACLGLFIITDISAGQITNGLYTGYVNLAVVVTWMSLSLTATLALIVLGTLLANFIRLRFHQELNLPAVSLSKTARMAVGRILVCGLSAIAAYLLYTVVGGSIPLQHLEQQNLLAVAAGIVLSFVVTQTVGLLFTSQVLHHPVKPIWLLEQQRHLLMELALLPVAPVLALILHNTGVGVFIIILSLIAWQAVHYQQIDQIHQALLRRIQEFSMLNTLGQVMSSNLMMDDLLVSLYEQIQVIVKPAVFFIALYDEHYDTLDFQLVIEDGQRLNWAPRKLHSGEPLEHVIRNQATLHITPKDADLIQHLNLKFVDANIQSFLGIPLIVNNKVLGVLALMNHQDKSDFDIEIIHLLQIITHQAALAIRNVGLFASSNELAEGLALINQVVHTALFTGDSDKALRAACRTALNITNAQKAAIFSIENGRSRIRLAQEIGLSLEFQHWFSILPYQPELHDHGPYIVSDLSVIETSNRFKDMAQKGQFNAFAEIPLRSGGEVNGLLVVYHDQPHFYRKSELDLLETLANHIASAFDNTRLFDTLESHAGDMAKLVHLSRVSTSSLQLNEVSTNVANLLHDMTRMNRVTVTLYEPARQHLRIMANATDPGDPPALSDTLQLNHLPEIHELINHPVSQPCAFRQGETHLSPQLNRLLKDQQEMLLVAAPMMIKDELLGVIFLGNHRDIAFSDPEWQFIETAVNHIAAQIYNARLHHETEEALNRRLEQLARIENIARQISSSLDFNQVISNVLDAALSTLQADIAGLALITSANEFWIISQSFSNGNQEKGYSSQPLDQGVMGQAAREGIPIIVGDNQANPHYVTCFPGKYHSSLAVPLIEDGTVIGILNVESVRYNFFTEEHASFLKTLAEHAVISIENTRSLEERQYQIDTLTALRRLSLQLSTIVDIPLVIQHLLQTSLDMLHGQYAAIFQYNADDNQVAFMGELQSGEDYIAASVDLIQLALDAAHSGELQTAETTQQVNDITHYSHFITVPLKRGNRIRAILCMAFSGRLDLQDRDLNAIDLLASQAAGHLETAMLTEQIRASSEQMRAILDSTKDGIIVLDRDARLIQSNPSAQALLGINLEDYPGANFIDLLEQFVEIGAIVGASYTPDEMRNMWRLLRLEPERITRRPLEREHNGQMIYLEEIGAPVLNTEGQIIGRLLVLRDITQEKQLKAFQDKIINTVVHDLRGPLGSIISSLKIAMDNLHTTNSTETVEKTLVWATDGAKRLMELVDTMMVIARMETMQLPLNRDPVSVTQLVESAYTALAATAQEANVNISLDFSANLPPVFVDGEKIQRVLINLLHNALKFTPSGGQILISAAIQPYARKIIVRVADSGPGIPASEREHIFEKFRQVEGSTPLRGGKGSGLGLTFCKLAVEAHEERIWIEAEGPLPGACFAFTLPIATDLSIIN